MQDGIPVHMRGAAGFVSKPPPDASIDALTDGSKNLAPDGHGSYATVPDLGSTALTLGSIPAGSTGRRASLVGGKRALGTSPGNATKYRGGLSAFVGEAGGSIRWEGAGPFSYLSSWIISITDGSNDAPLGLPVPPPLTLGTGTPAAGEYVLISGGQIKKTVALKIALFRVETNSESWLSQSTGPIVVGGSGAQFQVHAPTVPLAYDVGTFKIRIYSTPQGFGASPLAQYFRVAEIAPGATVTLNYTDADLGALAPYTADSAAGWTDPTTNPGKYGMPPKAKWLATAGAHLLTIGDYDPPDGHLFQPSVAFKLDTFDPDTAGVANPAEPFVDIVENANDGYILGLQLNAVGSFILTGDATYPVIYRSLYRNLGVKSKNQICTVSGEIFAWARKRHLVRSGPDDQPDSTFTAPVRAFLSGFTTDPLIGHDGATDRVCLIGQHSDPFGAGSAWCIIAYERGLPGDVWTTPIELTGFTPVTLEEYDNQLYLVDASGVWRAVFSGSSARESIAQFAPQTAGAPAHRKTVTQFSATASATPDVAITAGRDNQVVRNHAAVPLEADGSTGWRNTLANNRRHVSSRVTLPSGGTIDSASLMVGVEEAPL